MAAMPSSVNLHTEQLNTLHYHNPIASVSIAVLPAFLLTNYPFAKYAVKFI